MVDVVNPLAEGAAGGPDQFAQIASAVPREIVDPFSPTYTPPKGAFARGANVGLRGVAAAAAGTAALAARAGGSDDLYRGALAIAREQQAQAAPDQMRVEDVSDVSTAGDFLKYAAGYLTTNLAPSLALGAAGRMVGGAAAASLGGAASKLAGQQAGTLAGLAGSSLMQEIGSIFPEAIEQGVDDPIKRALVGGAIAAAADFIPEAYVARRLGLTGAAARAGRSTAANAGREALKVGSAEAGTELFQTYVERAAAGQPVSGDEAFSDYLNSGVLGALGGGTAGAVAGAYETTRRQMGDEPAAGPGPAEPAPPPAPEPAPGPAPVAPEPSAFRQFPADEARLDIRADQMRAADTSPAPVSPEEAEAITLRDRQTAATARLSALDAEDALPQGERRAKQEIEAERRALTAEIAGSTERLKTLEVLAATPQYQPKTRLAEPAIIGAPAQQAPVDVPLLPVDPVDVPGFARTAEQRIALAARGRNAPAIVTTFDGRPRSSERVVTPRDARERVMASAEALTNQRVQKLVEAGVLKGEKVAGSVSTAIKRAAEAMFAQSDPLAAKQALEDGIHKALKGKLKKVDADAFAEQFVVDLMQTRAEQAVDQPVQKTAVSTEREQPANAAGQLKLFSKTALVPATSRIVFSHWGNVPNGVTDPAKLGTGVKGADWDPAKIAGLSYTSAVVRGTDYKESAVIGSGRKQYVGSLAADKVYVARADDPLLKQAYAATAYAHGGTNPAAAWMEYAKAVRDLGYDAMLYAGGQLRIFTPQKVAPEPTIESLRANAEPVLSRHLENGGSTTNLLTGQDLGGTQNFAVSMYKDREQVIPGQPTKEQLRAFIEKNKDLLSTPDHTLGTWFNEDDGNTYLDVSIVVPDMAEALRIARDNQQLAIFDLRTFTTIPADTAETDPNAVDVLHSRAASERYEGIVARKGEEALSRLESIIGTREGLEVRTYTGPGAAGSISLGALKDVIELNLHAKDVLSTANHEGYHFLEYRVLTESERRVVEKAFAPGGDMHNLLLERARAYDAANGTQLANEIMAVPAEARAYGFEFWTRGELKADGVVARAWAAIKRLIERIANMVDGLGFQSYEDLFDAVRSGHYARKAKAGLGAPFRVLDIDAAYLADVEADAVEGAAVFRRDPTASGARGRPFWVNTPADVRNMRTRIRLLALEGAEARDWHARSGSAVMAWANGDTQRAAKLAALIANYSPRTPVGRDLTKAVTHLDQWENGRAINVGAPAAHIKGGNDILSGATGVDENGYVAPTGIKRQNFFRNLMLGIDPVRYNAQTQGSTIDMWMSHAFNYGDVAGAVTKSQYNYADAEVKRLAKELGWQVEETQAAIWVAIKARGDTVRSMIEKHAEKNGWYDYRLKKERAGSTSDMFGQTEGKYERFVKPEFARAFVTQWMNFALSVPFSEDAFKRANYSYLEAFQDLAAGRLQAEGAESLPFSVEDVADDVPYERNLTLFSRASLAELAGRARAGEIEQVQVNARVAELLDSAEAAEGGLRDKLVARGLDELSGVRGGVKRGYLANFSSGENLARQSLGYKNVFGALTAFTQRKNRLIADAVEKRLSTWVKGSTEADKMAASKALLDRTVNGYLADSAEYTGLLGRLTPAQQAMFKQATGMIADRLDAEFRADAAGYGRILGVETEQYRAWFEARRAQVEELKARGYFPERRYGDHIVHAYVEGDNGKKITLYYSQHEREADARVEEREVKTAFGTEPEVKIEYGYRYKADYDGSLSFQQFLDMANRHGVAITQAERERLARAMISADSVRRNRIFRRKNIAGYSEDGMRILAEFGVAMANKIAYHEVGAAVADAIAGRKVDATFDRAGDLKIETYADTDLWKDDGAMGNFYRNLADQTADFVLSPGEGSKWSRGLRAAASVQFLGGSIAAGMVQLTSIPMNTIPWLTQQTGYTDAFARTTEAFRLTLANRDVLTDIPKVLDETIRIDGIDNVDGLRHALQIAAQDGTTLDTEIYQIMGLSRGQEFSFSGRVQQAMKLWMLPFRVTEQINRLTTFIAAFKLAKDKGMTNDDAYKSAQETVYATQFRYDEANRPALARGDVGSLLFTFKTYPIFMAETLAHLARTSPSSAVFMLLGLTVMAGVEGLPFAEDLEDLIDTIAQRVFGSPFNTKRALRNVLKNASEAVVGADLSGIFMHGLANELTGLSFASRVGLGNFIPGTRVGTADADYKRVLTEILGPVGSMAQGWLSGADSLFKADFEAAAKQALPLAGQNAVKGVGQWMAGYATDVGGRKLIDVGGWESFWQTLGFSSAALGKAYESDRIDRQTKAFYTQAHAQFTKDLVKAVQSGDLAAAQRVSEAVTEWNKTHPDMPIALSPQNMRKAIGQAGMTLNQRTYAAMPKSLRGSSEYALGVDN